MSIHTETLEKQLIIIKYFYSNLLIVINKKKERREGEREGREKEK